MPLIHLMKTLTIFSALIISACMNPISKETRQHLDPDITFAMVSANPHTFLDRQLMLGGVIIANQSVAESTTLEIMVWRLSFWGEPLYLEDTGRRFLVRTSELLDPTLYAPGTLVTLAGVVLGSETKPLGEHDYNYPVLNMTEIHLWESPFRYGIHLHPDPAYPYHVGGQEDDVRNPYDPGYSMYPYTPYWYR